MRGIMHRHLFESPQRQKLADVPQEGALRSAAAPSEQLRRQQPPQHSAHEAADGRRAACAVERTRAALRYTAVLRLLRLLRGPLPMQGGDRAVCVQKCAPWKLARAP